MQHINFETTVKDGHIKIPERYSNLDNKKVVVDIFDKEVASKEKKDRVNNAKKFLQKCSGILKNRHISPDITMKQIKEMRLKEKYDR